MKYVVVIIIFSLVFSCDYFDVKKTSSEAILNEELQTFNWNEVDEFPTFSVCDSLTSKLEKESCFKTTLVKHVAKFLEHQKLIVTSEITDTLEVNFSISDKGETSINAIKVKDQTLKELPKIKELLIKSTNTLPQIYPAIKRGQQVNIQFKLPVIIGVD